MQEFKKSVLGAAIFLQDLLPHYNHEQLHLDTLKLIMGWGSEDAEIKDSDKDLIWEKYEKDKDPVSYAIWCLLSLTETRPGQDLEVLGWYNQFFATIRQMMAGEGRK